MTPDFEQLLQIIRLAGRDYQAIHLVLASEDDFKFLEVTSGLRQPLQEATREGYQPLGLLGCEVADGLIQARKMFFRWNEDPELGERFDRICEAGVDSVGLLLQERPGRH